MKAALRFCLALAALGTAPAVEAQSRPGANESETIVVTGRRLDDTRRALQECLARKCPPVEDMAASLAYAENLFIGGDYRRARSVVQDSMGRNDRFARQHPLEVATLYRADARISIHLGDGATYRSSTFGAVRALKKGLDKNDPTVLTARFDVAAMLAALNDPEGAARAYREIADDAARLGARDLAATAELREAWLTYRKFKLPKSLETIERIAGSTDAQLRSSRLAALVVLARLDRERGRTEGPERLLKALAEAGVRKPTLLWAPPVNVPEAYEGRRPTYNNQTLSTATEVFDKTWADVGFWVKPDGSVGEVEVLRSSGSEGWLKPVLSSISRRIYSPSSEPVGSYRVERYTWTSLVRTPSGTRVPQHSPQGRIEYVDLTVDPPGKDGTR